MKWVLVASDHIITRINTHAFVVHCVCPRSFDWVWPFGHSPHRQICFPTSLLTDFHDWTITLKCFPKVCYRDVKVDSQITPNNEIITYYNGKIGYKNKELSFKHFI